MKPLFVFDLDSTITKCELLPMIAEDVGLGKEMAFLTEIAMQGRVDFEQDFRKRVALLKDVPVSRIQSIAAEMPLHEKIAGFISQNPESCIILTGNLDVWIMPIIEKQGMKGRCICSEARVRDDRLLGIASVLDKGVACKKLPHPFVAIGDGGNDIGMMKAADVGIAFGGARKPPAALISVADMVAWNESELIEKLERFL